MFKSKISTAVIVAVMANTALPASLNLGTKYSVATETSSKAIEKVFKKFRYDMTVVWDQNDAYFKQEAEKELEIGIEGLKAQGVADEAILAYVQSTQLDAKTQADYTKLLNTIQKQGKSADEAKEMAMNFMEKSQVQGANIAGGASGSMKKILIAIGVVIIGVVTFLIIKKKCNNDSSSTGDDSSTTGNNGWGNGDQDAPGGSCSHNNAENHDC